MSLPRWYRNELGRQRKAVTDERYRERQLKRVEEIRRAETADEARAIFDEIEESLIWQGWHWYNLDVRRDDLVKVIEAKPAKV